MIGMAASLSFLTFSFTRIHSECSRNWIRERKREKKAVNDSLAGSNLYTKQRLGPEKPLRGRSRLSSLFFFSPAATYRNPWRLERKRKMECDAKNEYPFIHATSHSKELMSHRNVRKATGWQRKTVDPACGRTFCENKDLAVNLPKIDRFASASPWISSCIGRVPESSFFWPPNSFSFFFSINWPTHKYTEAS